MIYVSNAELDPVIYSKYPPGSIKGTIIGILSSSTKEYIYPSIEYLEFELELRQNIIFAATELYRSSFSFKTFQNSKCNDAFWERTEEGGFLSRGDVKSSDALKDVYINSSLYGTECATAIIIILYRAIVEMFPESLFNEMFPVIYLMDWQYSNNNLGIHVLRQPDDYLPGDCRYFKNPDVDPVTPQWQGENVIDLGFGEYYGHGIGIGNSDRIIEVLNRHRIPDSQTSAFLMDIVTRPGFRTLAGRYLSYL